MTLNITLKTGVSYSINDVTSMKPLYEYGIGVIHNRIEDGEKFEDETTLYYDEISSITVTN